jgi:hypothetical protein
MMRREIGLEIAELVLCCGIGSEEDVYIYRFLVRLVCPRGCVK